MSKKKRRTIPRNSRGQPSALRILIHDYAGHAFQVQLSRELARRGNEVLHVYAASNPTPKGGLVRRSTDPSSFTVEGLTVDSSYERYSFVKRWRYELEYGRALAQRLSSWQPDVAISCNTPLDSQRLMLDRCRRSNIPLIFWVQDLFGVAANSILRQEIPLLGAWIGRYYLAMERRTARGSHAVILITEDFGSIMRSWGVPESQVVVIENWAPLDEIDVVSRDNPWARSQGLVGKTCFLYTGMMGLKHDPGPIYRLAQRFRDRPDVAIVVVSQGRGAEWLAKRKSEDGLDNMTLLGFQPYERMSEVLASGDILVAILERNAGVFSVPSKVLTYHCAERPLLAAIPAENLAARIISEKETGLVVDPRDPDAFVSAAETLLSDPALRQRFARNARAYAERSFNVGTITTRFEEVIRKALS